MGKFREKLYRFMYGRYGTDELYRFTLIVVLVLIVAELFVRFIPDSLLRSVIGLLLSLSVLALYAWMIFRSLSKNVYKRRRENEIYLKASRAIKRCFSMNTSKRTKSRNRDDQYYIFRDCTFCGATLRLPRKSGKHSVRCPKCAQSFYVKSK
ncbi:MAG: hypothetical protein IJY39_12420 [Clostridia bacterium]|nr:hypothetical protein [Clostridia bacterium]